MSTETAMPLQESIRHSNKCITELIVASYCNLAELGLELASIPVLPDKPVADEDGV
jgi:hypothetical protein